jgi:pSer/pThr/pTyr-binding forkhead associated (FHA) protein
MDNPAIPAVRDATGGFQLLVISNETRVLYPLPERGTVIVGRSDDCDVRIADPLVDRRHVCIHIGSSFEIEDLGAPTCTYMGGRRLVPHERTVVVPGEAVVIGTSTMTIQP